ncbi:helix-turn-helix domain-containing protein [Microvirga sp. 3-52]|nr:helix-turn-helix domain-containing protein [Microvirga sp. 3-52]
MISIGQEKISTVALDVGFSDYRYFIKVFKRYTNALPSDFVNYYKN